MNTDRGIYPYKHCNTCMIEYVAPKTDVWRLKECPACGLPVTHLPSDWRADYRVVHVEVPAP